MSMSGSARKVRLCFDRTGYPIEVFAPSLAQQAFVEECDINNIVKRNPDILAMGSREQPLFGEFADMPSYHEALNLVISARESFDSLPSAIRTRFNNDPSAFLEFMGRAENYDEAVRLGIVVPNAEPVVEPAASAAAPAGG